MKKCYLFLIVSTLTLLLGGCHKATSSNTIEFATSADYPPFEYVDNGKIQGFDIELAKLVAKEMGKKAVFKDMQFSAILPAVQNGMVDAAISTMTITKERQKNFDFSTPYYNESMSMVFNKPQPITNKSQLPQKKIACQLGTTMEIWLNKHGKGAHIVTMDNNNQAIEALKAGLVNGVLMDSVQAATFSQKNPSLSYAIIAQSHDGYGIAFKKGSPLLNPVNKALQSLAAKGEIKKLEQQWLKIPV